MLPLLIPPDCTACKHLFLWTYHRALEWTSVCPPEGSALCRHKNNRCDHLGRDHKAVRKKESGQTTLREGLYQQVMISLLWGLLWCCSSHRSQHQKGCEIAATFSRAALLCTANHLLSLECKCLSDWDTKRTGISVQNQTRRTTYLSWLNKAITMVGIKQGVRGMFRSSQAMAW